MRVFFILILLLKLTLCEIWRLGGGNLNKYGEVFLSSNCLLSAPPSPSALLSVVHLGEWRISTKITATEGGVPVLSLCYLHNLLFSGKGSSRIQVLRSVRWLLETGKWREFLQSWHSRLKHHLLLILWLWQEIIRDPVVFFYIKKLHFSRIMLCLLSRDNNVRFLMIT